MPERITSKRLLALALVLFVAMLGLTGRLWYLQVNRAAHYQQLAQQDYVRSLPISPPRGKIVSAGGTVLADERPSWELEYLNPGSGGPMPKGESAALARLLGTTTAKLSAMVAAAEKAQPAYWPVILDPNQGLTSSQITRYEEDRVQFPDLHLLAVPQRYYPQGSLMGNFIGYLGDITAQELKQHPNQGYQYNSLFGQAGLEAQYESYLHGRPGQELVEVDRQGNFVRIFGQVPPKPGDTLHLTINWSLEKTASAALSYVMHAMQTSPARYPGGPYSPKATSGVVIVLDPENGDILAIASLPSYNPGHVLPSTPQFNYAIQGQYAPGSIFKPIIATGALASGVVTPNTIVVDHGCFTLDCQFKNWYPPGFGPVNMEQAIEYSDDVYFYWVGYWMGIRRMDHYIALYGLNKHTGIDVPGEASSVMPTPQELQTLYHSPWTMGNSLNTVIGQGLSRYTLIGMARAEAAVANGGTVYWPHLGQSITQNGHVVKTIAPVVQDKTGIPAWVYNVVHRGMEMSAQLPGGTGYGAMAGIPMPVATKTGTAQKANGTVNNAFFTTFAPANWLSNNGPLPKPQLDILVYIHDGVFGAYSGFVARAIYDQYFHLKDPAAQTLFDRVYGGHYVWPFSWK